MPSICCDLLFAAPPILHLPLSSLMQVAQLMLKRSLQAKA
jgi:hypothetical protein